MDDEWHFTHMLENFQFCPGSGYYLRILDEIHALTLAQQEALLQDMENLPNQLIVVACSAHPERLDLPFRSRFSEIKFSLIEQSLISNHLKDQIALRRLPVKPAFTDMIAYEAAGHLRTAILRLNLMATAQPATIDDCVDLLSIPHPKDILSWLVALFTSPEAANDSLIGLLKTKSPGPIIRVAKDLLKQSVWRDQKPSEGIPTPLLGAEWESFKAMFTIEQRLILAEAVINIDDGVIANLDSFLLKNAILSAQVCPPEFLPE